MRTNKKDRAKLHGLMKGLGYIKSGMLQNNDTETKYGIRRVKKWIKKNSSEKHLEKKYFEELLEEVRRK